MSNLEGRIAIVTGAAQGINEAIARKLDADGATVIVSDLNGDGAADVARSLERGDSTEVDISSPESVDAMVAKVLGDHGRIDVLVNGAGIVPFVAWTDVDLDHWKKIIDTNLTGTYLCTRAVWKEMREAGYGRIVNIASNSFLAGTPNMAAYVASKGGIIGFTRSVATEIGGDGITINCVSPGLTASKGAVESPHNESFEFVQSLQAIPRRGETEDIAPTVSFLASEEAAWVTGQNFVVDGGHTRN